MNHGFLSVSHSWTASRGNGKIRGVSITDVLMRVGSVALGIGVSLVVLGGIIAKARSVDDRWATWLTMPGIILLALALAVFVGEAVFVGTPRSGSGYDDCQPGTGPMPDLGEC